MRPRPLLVGALGGSAPRQCREAAAALLSPLAGARRRWGGPSTTSERDGGVTAAAPAAARSCEPALLLLKAWGDRHLQPDGAWTLLRHRGCAGAVVVDVRCPDCGEVLTPDDVETIALRELPA